MHTEPPARVENRHLLVQCDEQGYHVKTLSGLAANSRIDGAWDLEGGDVPVTGDLWASVALSDSQAARTSESSPRAFIHDGRGASLPDQSFVVAYDLVDWTNAHQQERIQAGISGEIVDPLSSPFRHAYTLYPDGNRWNCCAFMLDPDTPKGKKTLFDALKRGNNFYYFGHGVSDAIGTHSPGVMARSGTDSVAVQLGFRVNPKTKQRNPKRFLRLVILDGCHTYSPDWAGAFGVPFSPEPKGSPYTCADFRRAGLQPRAFVGWTDGGETPYDGASSFIWAMFFMPYHQVFDAWMSGASLEVIMGDYTIGMLSNGKGNNALTWLISGCKDLKRREFE